MSRAFAALPAWLTSKPQEQAIAISTRIRLARNFPDVKFPVKAQRADLERVLNRVASAASAWRPVLSLVRLKDLDPIERGLLGERGLVQMDSVTTPDLVGLARDRGETVSLLLNEEDHLRIQVMLNGENLERGLALAREWDARLHQKLVFASDPQFGFLTACPTNVGTGLRASIMFHLPALSLTRGITQVLQAVLHLGLAVRGFYGEGTELRSVFFQISNQVTLGRTEAEIIQQLGGVTRQLIERETEARQKLLTQERSLLADKVGRAFGILSGCRLLGLEEGLSLLSDLRLGLDLGLVPALKRRTLNELMLLIQPAHLQAATRRVLSADEQALRRADLVKRRLGLKARRAHKDSGREKFHVR